MCVCVTESKEMDRKREGYLGRTEERVYKGAGVRERESEWDCV